MTSTGRQLKTQSYDEEGGGEEEDCDGPGQEEEHEHLLSGLGLRVFRGSEIQTP